MKKHNLIYYGLVFILLPFWYIITEVLTEIKWYWHTFGLIVILIGIEMLSFAFDE